MKDLTVIIPILSLDSKEKKDMFKKALKSASGACKKLCNKTERKKYS